ncbi:MAG: carboxypeptidase regulatory-like domain-containing protein [Candidatus Sulfotelmatobacter sp.]
MRSKHTLLIVFFLLSFKSSPAAQRAGRISGTVVRADGYPVADARVNAEIMDGEKAVTGLVVQTDEHGRFLFSHLKLGEYRLSAEKQEAGYLSTAPDIFTCKPPLTIVLREESPTADTSVRFMPKGATISGWVKDAKTAKAISAHLSLAPISECGWSTTGTAGKFRFELLVPSDTPITFGACAEGYKPWTPLALNLRPGSKFEIDVLLERSEENEQTLCPAGTY